jgi:hypothetical protein
VAGEVLILSDSYLPIFSAEKIGEAVARARASDGERETRGRIPMVVLRNEKDDLVPLFLFCFRSDISYPLALFVKLYYIYIAIVVYAMVAIVAI